MRPSEYDSAPSALEHSSVSYKDMVSFLDRHRLDSQASGDVAAANRAGQLLKYLEGGARTVVFGGVKYTLTADGPGKAAYGPNPARPYRPM